MRDPARSRGYAACAYSPSDRSGQVVNSFPFGSCRWVGKSESRAASPQSAPNRSALPSIQILLRVSFLRRARCTGE
jgi:hypothetical protein